jgi:hypothetical protein
LGQLAGDAEIALHGEFNTHARRFGDEPAAAIAERRHLENLVGRPVQGVGMHGGELSNNRSDQTDRAVEQAGLLYDSTARPGEVNYFFPFRKRTGDLFGQSYQFPHALADVEIPVSRRYSQMFYERAIARLEQVYSKNGIFILLMHPEYFGFFAYLFHLKNLRLLFSFLMTYFKRSQRTH